MRLYGLVVKSAAHGARGEAYGRSNHEDGQRQWVVRHGRLWLSLGLTVAMLSSTRTASASVAQNNVGCAKLFAVIETSAVAPYYPNGFRTYLQSYGRDCATPKALPCDVTGVLSSDNHFRVRTHVLHQDPAGNWQVCAPHCDGTGCSGPEELAARVCPNDQSPVTWAMQEAWLEGFDAFVGGYCGEGPYKLVAEGELMTSDGILYLTAESNVIWGRNVCRSSADCNDFNVCTSNSCEAGKCVYPVTADCMRPALRLLEDPVDAVLEPSPRPLPRCDPLPRDGCRVPDRPNSAPLKVKGSSDAARRSLDWRWATREIGSAEFGDPTTSDDYALCLYKDGAVGSALIASLRMPKGTDCAAGTCWKRAARGFVFSERTEDRLVSASFSATSADQARIKVKAKGGGIETPQLPVALPLVVQLQAGDGRCWSAEYGEGDVSANDPARVIGR